MCHLDRPESNWIKNVGRHPWLLSPSLPTPIHQQTPGLCCQAVLRCYPRHGSSPVTCPWIPHPPAWWPLLHPPLSIHRGSRGSFENIGIENPTIEEKGMAAHSSSLTWEIPWTEEPGGLQSKGLQRVAKWLSPYTTTTTTTIVFQHLLNKIWSSHHGW